MNHNDKTSSSWAERYRAAEDRRDFIEGYDDERELIPPLVAGGQGRTDRETVETASHLARLGVWALIIIFCIGCWALVAALFGIPLF